MRLYPSQKLISNFSPASLAAVLLLTALFLVLYPALDGPQGFIVRLPPPGRPAGSGAITLKMSAKGDLTLNENRVTMQSLGRQLAARIARTGDSAVVIRADREVRFHQTVRVLEIARNAGANRVIIANQPGAVR